MKKLILILLALTIVAGCGGGRTVTRLDPASTQDLSGKWNDTDARLVAEEMIQDCLSRPWLTEFVSANSKKPAVVVGRIRNNSSEHIDTEVFTTDFERELLNSGQVDFVANNLERDDVHDELEYQRDYASEETVKQLRNELGADFILLGAIKTITDQEEGRQVIFYQTDLELINVESAKKVWIGTKKIKKGISQDKTKW